MADLFFFLAHTFRLFPSILPSILAYASFQCSFNTRRWIYIFLRILNVRFWVWSEQLPSASQCKNERKKNTESDFNMKCEFRVCFSSLFFFAAGRCIFGQSVRPAAIIGAFQLVLTSQIIASVDTVTIEGIAIPRAYTGVSGCRCVGVSARACVCVFFFTVYGKVINNGAGGFYLSASIDVLFTIVVNV